MELTRREKDKRLHFSAALLAERRKTRGEPATVLPLAQRYFHH